jgi:flagellin
LPEAEINRFRGKKLGVITMAIVINTNIPSQMASHHMYTTRDKLETAMERLSSGKRINSADDDAAGTGIAMRLMSQIRGTKMAMRNANDGISMAQVAEGALVEVENMLQRIRELAVQKASSNTYSATDITNINSEITNLSSEIDDIAANTKFNNTAVSGQSIDPAVRFDGSTATMAIPAFLSGAVDSSSSVANIDTALNSISAARGSLGAIINRLEYTVNNLSNVSANTSAAYSRIMDADYAAESAEVAKGTVLQQAGAAMLAQANSSPQYVLSLLQ